MATVAEQIKAYRLQQNQGTVAQQVEAYQRRKDLAYEVDLARPPRPDGKVEAPSQPVGYETRRAESTVAPDQSSGVVRNLQVGAQGVGRGLAGILGLPVDLAELALNSSSKIGERITGVDLPTFSNSVGGSDSVADLATAITQRVADGVLIEKEDMTPDERIRHKINQLGTEGAVGSALLSRFRGLAPRSLAAPHAAPGSNARVVAGDTSAGAGSGAVMGAYQEYVPETTQEKFGVVGEILAGVLGGVGGAKSLSIGEAISDGAKAAADPRKSMPTEIISADPSSMLPVRRKDFGKAAQLYRDGFHSDASMASSRRRLEEYLSQKTPDGAVGEGPDPTTALILNDPAHLSAERRTRTLDSPSFVQADRAVMNDASSKLASVRPDVGKPDVAIQRAADIAEQRSALAEGEISVADALFNRQKEVQEALADNLPTASRDEASRALDDILVKGSYLPARTHKNQLYDEATTDDAARVGNENVRAAAVHSKEELSLTNPALQDHQSAMLTEAFDTQENGKTTSQVMADRQALGSIEAEARAKGDFGRADVARSLKRGMNDDIRAAAESGTPGTEKLAVADQNYREEFAPFFRTGHVSPKFFDAIDKDASRALTPPELTASKFLKAGPNSRTAAMDIAKILRVSPDRAEGLRAAREYLIADAVGKGIVRKGEISEIALARFMAEREGALSQLPDVKRYFDELLSDVRNGNAKSNELRTRLQEAKDQAKLTERELNEGALRLLIDHEPRKAVAAVFGNMDPPTRMKQLKAEFSGNSEAMEGWKAAVADYLTEKVTSASQAAASSGFDSISLTKSRRLFEQNREALSHVFEPEEMQKLQQVQARLEILSRRGTQASSGSATAENASGGLRAVIGAFASPVGTVTTLARGALMGGSYERRTRLVAEQFPDANTAARKIIDRARFDPVLAKHLLDFPTSDVQAYSWSKKLNQLIVVGNGQQ